MFSDRNFSYGIEPIGSGGVSQHTLSRADQQVEPAVNTPAFKTFQNRVQIFTKQSTFSLTFLSMTCPDSVTLSLNCCMESIELMHEPPAVKPVSCLVSAGDMIRKTEAMESWDK